MVDQKNRVATMLTGHDELLSTGGHPSIFQRLSPGGPSADCISRPRAPARPFDSRHRTPNEQDRPGSRIGRGLVQTLHPRPLECARAGSSRGLSSPEFSSIDLRLARACSCATLIKQDISIAYSLDKWRNRQTACLIRRSLIKILPPETSTTPRPL